MSPPKTGVNPDPAAIERRLGSVEKQKEKLRDLSETSGGQRTEVGPPYDGSGNLAADVRDEPGRGANKPTK